MRWIGLLAAALLIVGGVFLPVAQIDKSKAQQVATLEREAQQATQQIEAGDDPYQGIINYPYPISGANLFRLLLFVDGALLGAWSLFANRRRHSLPQTAATLDASPSFTLDSSEKRTLLGLVLLGGLLRVVGMGRDMWLDEITTLVCYVRLPLHEIFLQAMTANNHLLNSVLCHLSVSLLGSSEWAMRLPSVLFGIGAVPLFYLLARTVTDRRETLLAATLFTLSYHHIYYSQEARGYSGYLFGALLATYGLVRAVRENRPAHWTLAGVGTVLCILSLIIGLPILATHLICLALLLWSLRRRPDVSRPLLRRALWTYGGALYVILHAYILVVPDILGFITHEHRNAGVGWKLSGELARVIVQGIPLGSVTLIALVVIGGLCAAGVANFWRQDRFFTGLLLLPPVLTLLTVVAMKAGIYPRFFIFVLPIGILFLTRGVWCLLEAIARRVSEPAARQKAAFGLYAGALALFTLVSARMLVKYYAYPKQNYTGARQWIERQKQPGDAVVAVDLAGEGYRYYWPAISVTKQLSRVRELQVHSPQMWLIYDFPDDLERRRPKLMAYIKEQFERVKRFPGTVGGGDLFVCVPKQMAVKSE